MSIVMDLWQHAQCRRQTENIAKSTYNGLLIKNGPFQVSLLPKLCRHHQSHLEPQETLKTMTATGWWMLCIRVTRTRERTLLWTSHGFVMADRSQAVIIIALRKTPLRNSFEWTSGHREKWSNKGGYFTWQTMHLHDNFLPGRVVGDVADLLLLLRNPLYSIHNLLEHCSLPERRECGQIFSKVFENRW